MKAISLRGADSLDYLCLMIHTITQMDALSVCSWEVCQLSTGTRMEVSLKVWSWQRLDAAPLGSIRS